MASSLRKPLVILKETDIPGACLPNKNCIEANSVVQLKRWLECRNLSRSGKKEILVKRVKDALNKDVPLFNGTDKGTWYNCKRTEAEANVSCVAAAPVPLFPITGWCPFPSKEIPKPFCYGSIYHHFVESASLDNAQRERSGSSSEDDCNNTMNFYTSKPLRKGRIYFMSGHVQNIKDCLTSRGHYCVKADVTSSFRSTVYTALVMVDSHSGKILDSHCQCVASSLGRCNHIAGSLFALEDYVITFGNTVACTSKLCSWNKGRNQKDPSAIMERKYNNKHDPVEKYHFVPIDLSNLNKHATGNLLLEQFKDLDEEHMILWQTIFDYYYEDYDLTEERTEELRHSVTELLDTLTFSASRASEITSTVGQAANDKWSTIRWFFVTASNAQKVFNAKEENYSTILNTVYWNRLEISTKYTDHGIKFEPVAREQYKSIKTNIIVIIVIWTHKRINIERIIFDLELWNRLHPKLMFFHRNVLCVDYFEHRVPRRLTPFILKTN